jgi:solute carrier family 35 protein
MASPAAPTGPRPEASITTKVLAAAAYGLVSMGIMVVHKLTMTSYKFPSSSFVGLAQMVFTIVILYVLRAFGAVDFPRLSWDVCRKVNPLPLLFLANLVSGLGGTKAISLPMFTVLRRFSIVMTMAGQYFLLGKPSSCAIQATVWVMVIGAAIAASNDLGFDLGGYGMILANDFFTAANGIYIQKKAEARELGESGIIFYNALLSVPLMVLFMLMTDPDVFATVAAFDKWADPAFILCVLFVSTRPTRVLSLPSRVVPRCGGTPLHQSQPPRFLSLSHTQPTHARARTHPSGRSPAAPASAWPSTTPLCGARR